MARIKKLQRALPSGIDAVLVTSEKNQRYLTGFDYTDGYVLITREKAYMFADFRYIEAAKKHRTEELEVVLLTGRTADIVGPYMGENKISRLGYEDSKLTCAELVRLKTMFPLTDFQPVGSLIEDMRELKDESEIEAIVKAQRIAEDALTYLLNMMTPSMTEREAALELEFYMRRHGAEAAAFSTIAVSGSESALPHGVPRGVKLQKGFFTLDFGALYDGYCSDMTRTVVIGKADAEMKKIYNTVLEAQLAALDAVKAGITGKEADKTARDIINKAGYEGCFGHGLGHGVGMYIHEKPTLNPASDKPLKPGHVVTVEPGIYIEGKYGVRIEDMVFITDKGTVNLTKAPKDLIELF